MGKELIRVANWYDYPEYYDIAFQAYTRMEADFIEAACRKHCACEVRRLLEPACGSGRLLVELAGRGYDMVGFDLNPRALRYLRRRHTKPRLRAKIFRADMSEFCVSRPVDAAYCTVSTFRHLLTEQAACAHLECIAESLCPGGIYIIGLHLLTSDGKELDVSRWAERRKATEVTVTLRVLRIDQRRRLEKSRVDLLVRTDARQLRLQHDRRIRTYTARQFRKLLDSVPLLELCDVYDFRYDIERPLLLNDKMGYTVFVLRRRLSS